MPVVGRSITLNSHIIILFIYIFIIIYLSTCLSYQGDDISYINAGFYPVKGKSKVVPVL